MRSCFGMVVFFVSATWPSLASAVRPFVTDDARVVGDRAMQVETWARFDKHGIQQWVVPAVGPVAPLELSLGGVVGTQDGKAGVGFPLIQAKALALETKPAAILPGLALVAGTFGPAGTGPFKAERWDIFGYAAFSESLVKDDRVLLHQNIGCFITDSQGVRRSVLTWGLGTQIHVVGGLHFVGEIFSGDPYAASATGAFQAGGRYFVSRIIQVDATFGHGLWGGADRLPAWGSIGLRIASDPGFL